MDAGAGRSSCRSGQSVLGQPPGLFTRLNCLPDWIASLGHSATGDARTISLNRTALSLTMIDQIRSAAVPGVEFSFSEESEMTGDHFLGLERAFAFWQELAARQRNVWLRRTLSCGPMSVRHRSLSLPGLSLKSSPGQSQGFPLVVCQLYSQRFNSYGPGDPVWATPSPCSQCTGYGLRVSQVS